MIAAMLLYVCLAGAGLLKRAKSALVRELLHYLNVLADMQDRIRG